MSYCLAFDASAEECSVALGTSSNFSCLTSSEPRSHSLKLLPFAEDLLIQGDCDVDQLDFIACSMGPGSFTGLRIAYGVAQGLAFSLDIPLLGVSSLHALALRGSSRASLGDVIVPVLDARMNEVYWAAYRFGDTGLELLTPQTVVGLERAREAVSSLLRRHSSVTAHLIGPGVELLRISGEHETGPHIESSFLQPNAREVGALALQKWNRGGYEEDAVPDLEYLRNSVSWNKRRRIRQV